MTQGKALISALVLLVATNAHAQLYKSVGPDGKVTYSDAPPAPGAKVEKKVIETSGGGYDADLPYELSESVKNQPVTLYTAPACVPCDEGRTLLTNRGIPFREKTVSSNDDLAAYRQLNSNTQLPLLVVGREKQRGYEATMWNGTLTAAGYPATSKLPKGYRNRPAEPLVPPKAAPEPTNASSDNNAPKPTTSSDTSSRPATGNAPPGFRF